MRNSSIGSNNGGIMGSYEERKLEGVTDTPSANWLQNEAKQKLQEAFHRLNLDSQKVNGKHLASLAMEDLMQEKRKVKNVLKNYD